MSKELVICVCGYDNPAASLLSFDAIPLPSSVKYVALHLSREKKMCKMILKKFNKNIYE